MEEKNYSASVAKIFKDRENPKPIGNVVGKVISPFPNIEISILDGAVILDKDQLYCDELLMANYKRKFESESAGEIKHKTPPPEVYSEHTVIEKIKLDGEFILKDILKTGDLVLLIPADGEQIWFIVSKIKKLGGS